MQHRDAVPTEDVTAQLAGLAVWLLGGGTDEVPCHPPYPSCRSPRGHREQGVLVAVGLCLQGWLPGGLVVVAAPCRPHLMAWAGVEQHRHSWANAATSSCKGLDAFWAEKSIFRVMRGGTVLAEKDGASASLGGGCSGKRVSRVPGASGASPTGVGTEIWGVTGARQLLGQQCGGLGKVAAEVMFILSRNLFLVFVQWSLHLP